MDVKKPPKMCNGCGKKKQACECLELAMLQQIKFVGLPEPVREFVFAPPRRWRFDIAFPDYLLAVECEGGTWISGAHNRGQHFESDTEKYNEAVLLGWRVLRFNNHQINDGRAIQVIERALSDVTP